MEANNDRKLPAGRPLELAGLVDYQQGAVVSRTIIHRPVGTVTLFAFDREQGLSEHTAPYDALVYALEGEAQVVISGESRRLQAGQVLLMPAHEPHSLHALQQFKMLLVMIRS